MICFIAELPNVGDQSDGGYSDLAFSRDELLSNTNDLTVGKQFSINKVTPAKLLTATSKNICCLFIFPSLGQNECLGYIKTITQKGGNCVVERKSKLVNVWVIIGMYTPPVFYMDNH